MITVGAFLRRLLDRSLIVTLPLPVFVVVFLEPATRSVLVNLVLAEEPDGGMAVIVQMIVLPSADRSQVTRTFGVSPLSPFGPIGPRGPAGPVGPAGPAAPAAPAAPVAPSGPAGPVAPVAPVPPAGPAG